MADSALVMEGRSGALVNFAGVLAALLTVSALGADSPPVFTHASSDEVLAKAPTGPREASQEMQGSGMAQLDFDLLADLRDSALEGQPDRGRLNLFEGVEFDWVAERTAATATGYSLSGPLAGVEGGTVTLVVNGNVAIGSVWTPNGAYRIRTVGRMQVVERSEPSGAPVCAGPLQAHSPAPLSAATRAASLSEDDGSEIDVLAVYTPQARRHAGGHRAILAEIDHRVAWTNEAYAVSDVRHRVRLVGATETDYDERERYDDMRGLIGLDDGHMDEVHALRDRLAADVVVLWTTNGGLASLLILLDGSYSRFAFATVPVGSLTTFAHEIGHLMGVDHEREDSNHNIPFPYSHGYVLRGVRNEEGLEAKTIMQSGGGTLPRFSNPRQRYRGVPLGVPGDEPTASVDGPADAARSMNETRRVVANYRRSATRCAYRLAGPSEIPAAGGSYTLRVEAGAGCPWTVRSVDGFTTVTSGASGTGDGTVAYQVPANEGWSREAALAVTGRMHVASQPGLRPVKPLCERTAKVRELIEAELEMRCADIASADLARITRMYFDGGEPVQPVLGDFDGLPNLGYLRLVVPEGGSLPVGVFDGLASLNDLTVKGTDIRVRPGSFRGLGNLLRLSLAHNGVQTAPLTPGTFEGMPRLQEMVYFGAAPLSSGAFRGLSGLRQLKLWGRFRSLRAGAFRGLPNLRRLKVFVGKEDGTPVTVEPGLFDGLSSLEKLELYDLAEVPLGLFAGLTALEHLNLQYNAFTSLSPGVFEGLSSLVVLRLGNHEQRHVPTPHRQELTTLPTGLLADLPRLESLNLANVGLRELRPGAFQEVGETLTHLILDDNALTTLESGTFDGLSELAQLNLARNSLMTLAQGAFSGLPLNWLRLQDNRLASLPLGAFEGLASLVELQLQGNALAALPPDVFRGLRILQTLRLDNNRLSKLPPGLFAGVGTNTVHYGPVPGLTDLTLHGNPGAPFSLMVNPVVVSEPWQRPVLVAARITESAPFQITAPMQVSGGRAEAATATLAPGTNLSEPLAMRPTGLLPVFVRIASFPELPGGDECATRLDAAEQCVEGRHYTGIVLEAGAPLVLNGMADQREFNEPAEIDLANVFLEFDDSAIPTFSVRATDPSVATWELTDGMLRLTPTDTGTTTVTVTATARGRTATRTFSLTVPSERRFMRGWRLTLLKDSEEAP